MCPSAAGRQAGDGGDDDELRRGVTHRKMQRNVYTLPCGGRRAGAGGCPARLLLSCAAAEDAEYPKFRAVMQKYRHGVWCLAGEEAPKGTKPNWSKSSCLCVSSGKNVWELRRAKVEQFIQYVLGEEARCA